MSGILDDLETCGIAVGAADGAVIETGGRAARVKARLDGLVLDLTVECELPDAPDPELLLNATLAAPGDTSFGHAYGALVARRRIVDPPLHRAYDSVYELSKALSSLMGLLEPSPESATVTVGSPEPLLDSARNEIGWLEPGVRYRLVDERDQWALVDDGAGNQGWIPEDHVVR